MKSLMIIMISLGMFCQSNPMFSYFRNTSKPSEKIRTVYNYWTSLNNTIRFGVIKSCSFITLINPIGSVGLYIEHLSEIYSKNDPMNQTIESHLLQNIYTFQLNSNLNSTISSVPTDSRFNNIHLPTYLTQHPN